MPYLCGEINCCSWPIFYCLPRIDEELPHQRMPNGQYMTHTQVMQASFPTLVAYTAPYLDLSLTELECLFHAFRLQEAGVLGQQQFRNRRAVSGVRKFFLRPLQAVSQLLVLQFLRTGLVGTV